MLIAHAIFLLWKMKKKNCSMLHVAISELQASADFKHCCEKMGFKTLQDIITTGWIPLMANEHFNYRWFGELLRFMEINQILHLMPPKPDTFR
jgi:4-hydroxy-3-methylbut-2-en-1-yl diphosphate synthase IspG/GcpE